jgi:hypothetical protein
MDSFWPTLPSGNALFVFSLCLLVGTFVIYKFCLDQFGKPTVGADDNSPWKFVVLRYQTPPRQYLIGFSVYFASMMLIFLAVSIIGPGPFFQIMKAVVAALTQTDAPAAPAAAAADATLQTYPTFPILVAFYIVGLNPNLPKALDFELSIRGFAHHIAYIPTNIDRLVNYMRFSDMDLPADKLTDAWNAIDLRRPTRIPADLKGASATFDRVVMLYARAATLAGDLNFEAPNELLPSVNLEIFRQYRNELQNVSTNLLAIYARSSDLPESDKERHAAVLGIQRDLIKTLEWLYVIFACAVTVVSGANTNGRFVDRLRAIGFVSPYPSAQGIPWDPVLRVVGAAALVLAAAWLLAANTFMGATKQQQIPTDARDIMQLLAIMLVVHIFAIAQALALRTKLIGMDAYYAEAGNGHAVAFLKIFAKCLLVCASVNLVLYSNNLVRAFSPANGDHPASAALLWQYFTFQLTWAIVPAICGVMTAYTLDRPAASRYEQGISGALEACAMAVAALVAVALTFNDASVEYRAFVILLYGGFGLVLGALLPKGIKRQIDAQVAALPGTVSVLRNAVRQYFYDIQQFSEWLNTRNDKLDGKRPLDVLAEDNGLQQLTSFVGTTRQKIAVAAP